MAIQVVYDAACSACLRAVQLVAYREETLQTCGRPVPPTVELKPWPSAAAEQVLRGLPASQSPASVKGRVLAKLSSGLVLPSCQDDPMRLIYEMEYMAFVRLPSPELLARVDGVTLLPFQGARRASQQQKVCGKHWWATSDLFSLAARALHQEHIFVLDDFLPDGACELLVGAAKAARPEMVRGATGAAGKVLAKGHSPEDLDKVLKEPSRGDVVKFADDGQMPGCEELTDALDALVGGLQQCPEVRERLRFVDWANGAMFAIYPGDASRYIKHIDNTLGTDGRRLTAVLYLNQGWAPADGGCLRIFEPTMQSFQVKRDVEPIWNRLVVFWSTEEVPHEVLSSYKDRLAVSVWFICGRESLRNVDAFQRLFSPQKLRCLAGRDRRACLERAAETEEERRALAQLPLETTISPAMRSYLGQCFRWKSEEEVEQANTTVQDQAIRTAIEQALGGQQQPKDAFSTVESVASSKAPKLPVSAVPQELPLHFEVVDDDETDDLPLPARADAFNLATTGSRLPVSFGIVD